jgi:amino acid adenylation domain-containing protein/non-ribosomal peptide synthase protein (TIGR01720 family)
MTAIKILSEAKKLGIRLWVEQGALKYKAPSDVLSDDLRQELLAKKAEIIYFLENSGGPDAVPIADRSKPLPLSFGQKWLWVYSRLEEASSAYNIGGAFRMQGDLDYRALAASLNRIIRRHEALRTNFVEESGEAGGAGEARQAIGEAYEIDMSLLDMSRLKEEERPAAVMAEFYKQMDTPYRLEKDRLMRTVLLKFSEREHAFIIGFHHIVFDNQSFAVFLSELTRGYAVAVGAKTPDGGEAPSGKPALQYADYARWQNERLNGKAKERLLAYWREALRGAEKIPEIGGDFPRPDAITYRSVRRNYLLPEAITEKLKAAARRNGCSLYVVLLAILKVLLFQYSGYRDLIVGSPVAGRGRSEFADLIGLFFNTVVTRTTLDPEDSFDDYVGTVKAASNGALIHQELPFDLLVDELGIAKKRNRTPLFQVLFNMYQAEFQASVPGLEISAYNEEVIGGQNVNSKFDITLLAIEQAGGIHLDFSFKADLYREETAAWLVRQFAAITECAAENSGRKIGDFPELAPLAHREVAMRHDYEAFLKEEIEQSLVARFEKQVERHPDKTAVESGIEKLSFSGLKTLSGRVARYVKRECDGLPTLTAREKIRYTRQLLLDGWGVAAQEKLKGLTVFAAGAGGSGSPVIQQLALLGVGTIIICDFDAVELSNLNRQVLHDESRIGMNKAESAALSVRTINPNVNVVVRREKITHENIDALVGDARLIFDNVDNLDAKFAISECAVAKGIPHVLSSMIERSSYAVIFHTPHTPCFHCCYDRAKLDTVRELRAQDSGWDRVSNCVASPALYVSAGFAVSEALKVALGFENPAYNKYFFFNNQSTPRLPRLRGFKIVTYPFSRHFLETCKKNGFDWEQGYSGRIVEEIGIEKDPQCVCCSRAAGKTGKNDSAQSPPPPKRAGVRGVTTVGLLLSHGPRVVVGIMGVLKSGSTFVIMDPEFPPDRLGYILSDTDAHVILTDDENEALALDLRARVNTNIRVKNIKDFYAPEAGGELEKDESTADDIAYIVYTSGSLGKPKGVMQSHRNVLHYTMNYTNGLHISREDRLSLIPSFSFSAAMMDVFAGLLNGATICLYNIKKEGPWNLGPWLHEHEISVYHSVPTVFRHFTAAIKEGQTFPKLRLIDFGGEPVSSLDIDSFQKHFDEGCILVNGLGATELNVIRQYPVSKETKVERNLVPVGYPVEDTEVLLRDEEGNTLHYNQTGEMVIRSRYLSPGYWGLEEQTAQAFHTGPDGKDRFYRTGDLGRKRPDGCLEHLGRRDLQLKIRGVRIEPMEIEAAMATFPGVKEAVVLALPGDKGSGDDEKRLCGFYVPEDEVSDHELKKYLAGFLPDYMVPAKFVRVEKMPLTATGKVNRKALPELADGAADAHQEYRAPATEYEKILCEIWQSVLGMEKIGIEDNYFDLGGDSIKALQILSALRKRHLQINIRDLTLFPTISRLQERVSLLVEENKKGTIGEIKLLPMQRYFFELKLTDRHYWHTLIMLYKKDGFEREIVNRVFTKLIEYHDTLRVKFKFPDGRIVQEVRDSDEKTFDLSVFTLDQEVDVAKFIPAEAERIYAAIDLEKGPLIRLILFQTTSGDHLVFCHHHLISDAFSMRIICEDFADGYLQAVKGEAICFQPKTASLAEWSDYLHEYGKSDPAQLHFPYWKSIAEVRNVSLPVDHVIEKNFNQDNHILRRSLNSEITRKLIKTNEVENILLTALCCMLRGWIAGDRIIIERVNLGRDGGLNAMNLARSIGWFAYYNPVALDLSHCGDARDQLAWVKNMMAQIPNKGLEYEVLEYITLRKHESIKPLGIKPELFFNYHGNFKLDETQYPFVISPLYYGNSAAKMGEREFRFCVNPYIYNEAFNVNFTYNKYEYDAKTVENLSAVFLGSIERILKEA